MIGLSAQQIEEIESKFGVPVYIFHSDEFVENYKELENTIQKGGYTMTEEILTAIDSQLFAVWLSS